MFKAIDWVKMRIRQLLALLVFTPNLSPLSTLFKSEIFPWAFLFSLRSTLRFNYAYLLFVVYLLASTLLLGNMSSPLVPLRSLFAIINATLVFFAIQQLNEKEYAWLDKALLVVLFTNIGLALIQTLGLFPEVLLPFVRLFLERFTDVPFGEGRGVAGLFAEPSYLGLAIHYFFAYALFRYDIKLNTFLGLLLVVGLLLFNLLLTKSVTGLLYFSVFLLGTVRPAQLGRLLPYAFGLLLLMWWLGNQQEVPPRAVDFMNKMVVAIQEGNFWPFLMSESGFRMVGVLGGYWYGLVHPLGAGLGNWGAASLATINQLGLSTVEIDLLVNSTVEQFEGFRPSAFVADIFMEAGLFGFVLFVLVFRPFYALKKQLFAKAARPITTLFIFNLFFLGAVGDPIPWTIMGLVVYRLKKQNTNTPELVNGL